MSQLQPKSLPNSMKNFLDDASSHTSSTVTHRITRKQDDRSSSRRSISKNSSQKSSETMDLSKFYVKMTPTKEQRDSEPARPTILKRTDETAKLKRRSPTPVPGYLKRSREEVNPAKRQNAFEIENDILIAELQKKFDQMKSVKDIFQKRVNLLEKQLKVKIRKIQQLENCNHQLAQKEEISSKKLQQFQQIASIHETSLNEARSNLEKLKGIIKKNRFNELQMENIKLKKQSSDLKQQLKHSNSENVRHKDTISKIENEIKLLQAQNSSLLVKSQIREKNGEIEKLKKIISSSKSQKEEELEKFIIQKNESELRLKLKSQKLEINLAYLNRKRNEEIEKLKTKQTLQLDRMRNKICMIHSQYNELKLQCEKLKHRSNMFSSVQIQRKSLVLSDHKPCEDQFLFDLSP